MELVKDDHRNIAGMTPARWRVFQQYIQAERDGHWATQTEIASTLGISRQAVSQHVQWLTDEAKVLEDCGAGYRARVLDKT